MVDDYAAADTVANFAADLRTLRLEADSPTLAKLQHDTDISRTVLSSAFGGKQLPSARTVDRIVRACGGDAAAWVRRRDELAGLHRVEEPAGPEEPERAAGVIREASVADLPPAPRTGMRRATAGLLIAAAFLVGSGVSAGVSTAVATSSIEQVRAEAKEEARRELTESPVNPRAQINVHNGVDPALTPCVNDAEVATSSPRTNNTKLEIIWSNKCYAGWGRVTRYDEQISGNSVMVAIYPETAPNGPDRQEATEHGVQGAYTTLVVRPTPQTRLCTVGAVTVDGASIDLGEPLCI
ncbi:DUF2690 domain-containing protein [Agromyces protaetiae]|uniref:DUF2690 domain-containing protein n=1 Tax=Agromyces protaetiae TaxID=2509455 RepID=A0A4P6FCW9_9MICO|nr:DUF2690 domain-containing protein [Agromyces protaetiae]QAY72813.1 DUF2690 domain-containing protein [Agromyces protaetiae]